MLPVAQFQSAAEQLDHYRALKARLYGPKPPAIVHRAHVLPMVPLPAPVAMRGAKRWADMQIDHNSHVIKFKAARQRRRMNEAVDTLEEIAHEYGISTADMMAKHRRKLYLMARHEFCWRMHVELGWPLVRLGKFLSRDHSSIHHSVRAHAKRMASEEPDIVEFRVNGSAPEHERIHLSQIIAVTRLHREGANVIAIAYKMQMRESVVRFCIRFSEGDDYGRAATFKG